MLLRDAIWSRSSLLDQGQWVLAQEGRTLAPQPQCVRMRDFGVLEHLSPNFRVLGRTPLQLRSTTPRKGIVMVWEGNFEGSMEMSEFRLDWERPSTSFPAD